MKAREKLEEQKKLKVLKEIKRASKNIKSVGYGQNYVFNGKAKRATRAFCYVTESKPVDKKVNCEEKNNSRVLKKVGRKPAEYKPNPCSKKGKVSSYVPCKERIDNAYKKCDGKLDVGVWKNTGFTPKKHCMRKVDLEQASNKKKLSKLYQNLGFVGGEESFDRYFNFDVDNVGVNSVATDKRQK
jgi:hypothetical protein